VFYREKAETTTIYLFFQYNKSLWMHPNLDEILHPGIRPLSARHQIGTVAEILNNEWVSLRQIGCQTSPADAISDLIMLAKPMIIDADTRA
jgi:hypothetical protein